MVEKGVARYAAEFLGTFALVFTIGCNVLTGQQVWGGVSIACVLTVMIYALGGASGAHFNPAVSVALGLTGHMDAEGGWVEVAKYAGTQIIAGIVAGACYVAKFGESFNLKPQPGHSWWQAGLAEVLYTFMLCFVVLNVAASKMHAGKNEFYGLAIGFVIVAGAYSGGSVSMGCFNPAVAFGIDVSSAYHGVWYCFVYTFFELIGAGLAAGAFKVCRGDQEKCTTDAELKDCEVSMMSKVLSEFLGTFILVLTVGLNVLSGSKAGAFSIAASLMCMIYALGSVSGAHFNPAVTVAVLSSMRPEQTGCDTKSASIFIAVQIAAGVCAAFTYSLLMNGETFALKPAGYKWSQALIAEFMFTFVLAFVVLSVATTKKGLSNFFGFAIGMCVTVGGFAIGKISGGSLNPAVSIGISSSHIMHGGNFWPCLIYSLIEITAGVVAAFVFKVTQPSEYDAKEELKK